MTLSSIHANSSLLLIKSRDRLVKVSPKNTVCLRSKADGCSIKMFTLQCNVRKFLLFFCTANTLRYARTRHYERCASLAPDPLGEGFKMAVNSTEAWYSGLLGLASEFLNSKPPKIKECIQCLQAVFQFHPSPAIQARTHLQIGRLLVKYTKNDDLARSHLEKAVS